MNIYVDESIHEKYGFMLLAYVICPNNPNGELSKILYKYEKLEFHSLEKMHGNDKNQILRREMLHYLNSNCQWGVIVFPSIARWNLFNELPFFLNRLISLYSKTKDNYIYFDEGIIKQNELKIISKKVINCKISLCKSHEVKGIQLSDLVASLTGVQLREEISQFPKILIYGEESGFNPPLEASLGYELWASLRYCMCKKDEAIGVEMPDMASFITLDYGLFFSNKCSEDLKLSAKKIFGQVYLGCIH